MKKFLITYPYYGVFWAAEIYAVDQEDAVRRLKAMTWGHVDGELQFSIPEFPGALWVVRVLCWVRSVFKAKAVSK